MSYQTKILVVCFLCIPSIHSLTLAHSKKLQRQQTGKVQFNALLPNDVLIPGLTIIIEGNNFKKEFILSHDEIDSKANLIELPTGIYQASSLKGIYYSFRRAPFRVNAGTVIKINIFPLIRLRSQTLMSDGSDRYEFAPEPKYDSLPVPKSPDTALRLLIRHDEKTKSKDYVEYTGNIWEHRGSEEVVPRGVMVSYDALTIYGEKVMLNEKDIIVEVQGNVVIEDGNKRIRARKVIVIFKDGIAEVNPN